MKFSIKSERKDFFDLVLQGLTVASLIWLGVLGYQLQKAAVIQEASNSVLEESEKEKAFWAETRTASNEFSNAVNDFIDRFTTYRKIAYEIEYSIMGFGSPKYENLFTDDFLDLINNHNESLPLLYRSLTNVKSELGMFIVSHDKFANNHIEGWEYIEGFYNEISSSQKKLRLFSSYPNSPEKFIQEYQAKNNIEPISKFDFLFGLAQDQRRKIQEMMGITVWLTVENPIASLPLHSLEPNDSD